MNDKELLAYAAKAAGIDWFDEPAAKQGRGLHLKSGRFWNPLTDDGDALRLAVKLHLQIECMVGQTAARTFNNRHAGCVDHADTQKYPKRDFNPCPYAATRRAIVRAAAEIGRSVK